VGQAGAIDETGIVITPEMIEAGVSAFYAEYDRPELSYHALKDLVGKVLFAGLRGLHSDNKTREAHR